MACTPQYDQKIASWPLGRMMGLLIKPEKFLLGVGIFLNDSKAFPKGHQVSGNVTVSLSKKQTGSTGCVWHLSNEPD